MAEQQTNTTESVNIAAPITIPVETVPLNTVLTSILRDSKKNAPEYLNQVHVPDGGE